MSSMDADVVVVGAGSVGSMAMWQLSRVPGLSVIGLERFGRIHSHGSYAGESRLFRTAYKEGALYVPLLQAARRLWGELEAESGRALFLPVGALNIGPPTHPAIVATMATIAQYGLEHEVLDTDDLSRRFPQHARRPGDIAVLDPWGGGLRPEASVLSALEVAERNGATLCTSTPVLSIAHDADRVIVEAEGLTIRAHRVVVTVGSWTAELMPALDDLLSVQQLGLTWYMPTDIQNFLPDAFPVFMRDIGDMHIFGAPTLDGYSVKVSGGSAGMPRARRVADLPDTLPDAVIAEASRRIADFFPTMISEPVRSSVHHESFTADKTPLVERDASGTIVTVAGLSGHGFKLAPVLGRLARDLVLGEASAYAREEFTATEHRRRREARAIA